MVRDEGAQLFTIEGIAAALIMLTTAYLVVNTTSVYTAGDTHVSDMQLEVIGNDALQMMALPHDSASGSPLQTIIQATPLNSNNDTFKTMFLNLTNNRTLLSPDRIQFSASYTCRMPDNTSASYPLSSSRDLSGGEHTIRATKWVVAQTSACSGITQDRAVLVEVLMWRD